MTIPAKVSIFSLLAFAAISVTVVLSQFSPYAAQIYSAPADVEPFVGP